jgi:phosphate transport system ATP-binding protein
MINISNLNVWYRENKILDNINIEVPKNVILSIMGPSGSGKSTLLRTINRLIELYPGIRVEGRITIDGIDIFKAKAEDVRRRIGMVFQTPNPIPNMTIFDNVALGPKLNKLVRNKDELKDLVRWALEKAYLWDEVKDRHNEPAAKLSGGQQQRLCIARALAMKPKVVLMDEPTSNLDPVATSKIEELLIELKKIVTIILVTHNPAQAARVSDYVAFLYNGRIIETGTSSQIFTSPRNELTEKYVTGKIG